MPQVRESDPERIRRVVSWIAEARCVVAHESGARVVIINGQPTDMDGLADEVLRGPIGEILPSLLD